MSLHIHQGSPTQIHDALMSGEVDLAITTEAPYLFDDLVQIPCYWWNRAVIVSPEHPLAKVKELTIEELGKIPTCDLHVWFYGCF